MKEIKPMLLHIWKNQGLNLEQMQERAASMGAVLPEGYDTMENLPPMNEIKSQRSPGSLKNFPMRSFRPNSKVDAIMSNIEKGKRSKFVNDAILNFVELKNGK